jgi:hypothetical protein
MPPPHGLYDLGLTSSVAEALGATAPAVPGLRALDADEAGERLVEIVVEELRRALADGSRSAVRPWRHSRTELSGKAEAAHCWGARGLSPERDYRGPSVFTSLL